MTRLLWVGHDRKEQTLLAGLPPRNELWVFSSLFLEKTPGFRQRAKTSRAAACEPQARAALRWNTCDPGVLGPGRARKRETKTTEGLANPSGLWHQSLMYSITLKSILNNVQPIKGFVYESVRYSAVCRTRSRWQWCHGKAPKRGAAAVAELAPPMTMRTRPRVWIMPPVFKFALVLIYTMRRVDCPVCGVVVEKVPWATGKYGLCDGFRLFLAHWARKLSWEEVAVSFKVSWADVYASVQWVVDYGLKHRVLENIQAIGVDEICVRVGRVFWTLIYQIDDHLTRLLWVGHDRTEQTLLAGLNSLGEAVCAGIRYVCSDMWEPVSGGGQGAIDRAAHPGPLPHSPTAQ